MSSSLENCGPTCTFDSLEPASEIDTALMEESLVSAHANELYCPQGSEKGLEKQYQAQGLDSQRIIASKGCAACIMGNACPKYVFRPHTSSSFYAGAVVERI